MSGWTFGRDREGDVLTNLKPWTKEDEEVLRQRYTGGQGLDRIAEILDRRPGAVKKKAQRLGLKRPASLQRQPKDDVATRLRVLLGEEVRPPTGRRIFSDEELLRFAGRGLEAEELTAWREATWDRVKPWLVDPPPALRDGEDAAWARLHGLDTLCREALHLELMDHQLAMALCALAS